MKPSRHFTTSSDLQDTGSCFSYWERLCSPPQGLGGPDGGGALPRGRGEHHPRRAGRPPLHLHLRGRGQAEGAEQENHLHPGHPAVQPDVHLAGSCRPVREASADTSTPDRPQLTSHFVFWSMPAATSRGRRWGLTQLTRSSAGFCIHRLLLV